MKPATVSATDAARGFGELLARVRYRRESFLIRRGRTIVARLVPVEVPAISGADAASAWSRMHRLGHAEAARFTHDLDLARASISEPPESRWER